MPLRLLVSVLEEPVEWDLLAQDVTYWGIAGPEWSYSLLVLCYVLTHHCVCVVVLFSVCKS